MARKSYTSLSLSLAPLGLSLLLAVGCGETGSDLDDHNFMPTPPAGDGGVTMEAGSVIVGDSGAPPAMMGGGIPDAGGSLPFDSGAAIPDAGGSAPDTGAPAPDSGAPDTGTPDGGATRPDQGMGDGKDVVTIGDSWMNLDNSIGIQQSLEKVSKRDYRNYGVPGTKLLDEVIPNQYKKAKGEGPIKTVVMTGGGNDVLQEILLPCLDSNFDNDNKCPAQIDRVAARLKTLWAEMSADGVTDVYIVGYSSKTAPLGLGSTAKSIAYSSMKIDPICQMVPPPLRCTAMDTDKEVPGLTIGADGIHPTAAGYDLLGAQVWKVMQEKGMRR